jgi:hypothetical protein
MRIKFLIMSSLLLLGLFAIKSYSVDWDNPDSYQSADNLMSSGTDNVAPSFTQQAQAARAAEMGQHGNDILSTPTGNTLASGATTPQESRSQDQNQTVATPTVAANTNVQAKPAMSSELAIVSGSWSFELNDSASRKAILNIF